MNVDTFLFCPTFDVDGIPQVHKRTLESIEGLDGDFEFKLGFYNPTNKKDLNVLNQYQTARELVLMGSFDYLLTVEHDMIVPPDALVKLKSTGAGVAYGLYMLRHGSGRLNAWKSNTGAVGEQFTEKEIQHARKVGVVDVSGVGFGCTLIRRDVLELLRFEPAGPRSHNPDVKFADNCQRNGVLQICRFDVVCGHIEPSGTVLWPFSENGEIQMDQVKVRVLVDFNASINAVTVPLEAGDEVPMPSNVADDYEKAGYVKKVKTTKRKPAAKKQPAKPTTKKGITSKSMRGE
jgi:hypothetical protein